MSFINEVKNEIIKKDKQGGCCELALFYGIIMSAGSLRIVKNQFIIEINTSTELIFDKVNYLTKKLYGGYAELQIDDENSLKHTQYIISIPSQFSINILTEMELFKNGSISLNFNDEIILNECCRISFLKGVFLASATSNIVFTNDKEKLSAPGYHLEFIIPNEEVARVVSEILALVGAIERTVFRGNTTIVYLSDYDSILNLLGVMGATQSYLKLESENVSRGFKKDINRQVNCLNANLVKQSIVASRQINAIKEINAIIGLNSLPAGLKELAKARLNNPELSLTELNKYLIAPITKSGINHRMRKIMKIYENLKN